MAAIHPLRETVDPAEVHGLPYSRSIDAAWDIMIHTFRESGGTFAPESGVPLIFIDRYAVGGYVDTLKIPAYAHHEDIVLKIAAFIERIPLRIDGTYHYLLGTWIEDKTIHVDAVRIIDNIDDAFAEAEKNREKAIYDFTNARSLYLP